MLPECVTNALFSKPVWQEYSQLQLHAKFPAFHETANGDIKLMPSEVICRCYVQLPHQEADDAEESDASSTTKEYGILFKKVLDLSFWIRFEPFVNPFYRCLLIRMG